MQCQYIGKNHEEGTKGKRCEEAATKVIELNGIAKLKIHVCKRHEWTVMASIESKKRRGWLR